MTDRCRAAVIGAGVSGLTAAYALRHAFEVTLYEADTRLGGHAHTHRVTGSDGDELRVDSGFIVHNERTYPHLVRLFRELGVTTQPTEMSMSVTCDSCGLSYAGGRGLPGLLAQPRRAADRRFRWMLAEVPRFHRAARLLLEGGDHDPTLGEFLARGRHSRYFVDHFALPLVACVWSSGVDAATTYPARHLFRFLDQHGMLSVTGSPEWRTVRGGSATYVDRLAERLVGAGATIRRGHAAASVIRHEDGVDVRADGDRVTYDRVVLAVHPDQALAVLDDATTAEKDDLAAIRYSINEAWLHRDSSVLPAAPRARASWNYRTRCDASPPDRVLVSYWMNRLHRLADASEHVVTLNPRGRVDPALVTAAMTYAHPVFTHEAVAAAARLRGAGGRRLAFAGAYLGWGFHEDGCRSGVEAAESLGARW